MTGRHGQAGFDADVVVVGGGPVGLQLGAELGLGGVAVTVLEERAEVDPTIKAGSINLPSAELLDRRGLWPRSSGSVGRTARASTNTSARCSPSAA
jgi:2-polyprenyl-6-methoxyphenol hydroxylase-like FAD-dependent oxidoreductase